MSHQFDNCGQEEIFHKTTWKERLGFAFYALSTVVCTYLLIVAVLSFEAIK